MTFKEESYQLINALVAIGETYFKIAKLSDVPENLFWLLAGLSDKGFHTQKEIHETWGLPKTTVNSLVKKLEGQGYLELIAISGRKRELQISLTEAGQTYTDEVLSLMSEVEREVLKRVKAELPAHFIRDMMTYSRIVQETVASHKERRGVAHEDSH
ncbi:TPA: winged helix-turn-helix transcriptional regulator [Streptococcus agalactiae]|uniref:Transcriptional regulator n=3 Tax=Streptococcus TaxID=1301 RepID=A0A146BET8_STRPY|nr:MULTISPECIES: MarR family winged helix-turn-helix transcriptional regulator [Streptococcus]AMW92428.1 transcriptional regulator [Streptococcus pyogenes]EHY96837.1 marR family protein [Streptococcus pneumoniae GA02254]MEE3842499.1 MarR family winged helix-turn-helix transcriptional regulator [Streptococcus sp. R4]VQI31861.1 MarR family [Streptococcus pneumoniae]AWZ35941.1 MarR family transcriptional regulator [Streptococcus agalactiae]